MDRSVMQSMARSGRSYKSKKESFADSGAQMASIPLALEASNLMRLFDITTINSTFQKRRASICCGAPGRFTIPNDAQHRIIAKYLSFRHTFYEATPP